MTNKAQALLEDQFKNNVIIPITEQHPTKFIRFLVDKNQLPSKDNHLVFILQINNQTLGTYEISNPPLGGVTYYSSLSKNRIDYAMILIEINKVLTGST